MDYCRKAVLYLRTRMVGNEAQGLALLLAMLTAYAKSAAEYASVAVLGELSSGKTRLVKNIVGQFVTRYSDKSDSLGVIPQKHIFHFTSASPTAMIYSDELKQLDSPIRIIEAAEYQKLSPVIIEYLKAQSGDDGTFVYEFTDVTTRSTQKITQKKRVVVFTFAQVDMDLELASRLIRFAVEENEEINKCVTMLRHGYPEVKYKGLMYDLKPNHELEQEIREQIEFIAGSNPISVENPFYVALRDLEDCSRPSAKRTAQLVEDLFKSSARFNFTEREFIKSGEETVIKMSVQDLVNVLCLTDIVQSMVLEIDNVDLGMLRYLGMRNNKSADQTMITNFLAKSGLPELKVQEFERRIKALINSNYVISWPDKDTKKLWYKLNEDKHIHPLTVHWDDAVAVDDSPVMNPITGERFGNILEFGKVYDETIRKGLEANVAVRPDYVPTFEEKLERLVKRLITSGKQYKMGDEARIRADAMSELGVMDLGAFEQFQNAINDMIRREIIAVDRTTLTYYIPDPSLNRKMDKTGRARLTYIPDLT